MRKLQKFFEPRSIAVIGASAKKGKVGHAIISNLVRFKFPGKIYPVNPRGGKMEGLKVYKDLLDVPGKVDQAVFVVPPPVILETFRKAAGKMETAIVISAGFKEIGPEGARLERELKEIANNNGITVMGPNCLGLVNTHAHLNASFGAEMPAEGNIAFLSQSGAIIAAILDWSMKEEIGFSKFLSLGNKMDLDETDLIEALADDPRTAVILGYIEGISDGSKFMRVAEKVSRNKPIIITKGGGTEAGAKAASSHTGTLAGSDSAYQAAFEQCGVIRAVTLEELFDFAVGFSYGMMPEGDRIVVVTNAGGPGIMAADAIERSKLKMASLESKTIEKLRNVLTPTAALNNPVDVIGDADAKRYRDSLEILCRDRNVDSILVLLTPQEMTEIEETARTICDMASKSPVPVFASFMGGLKVDAGRKILSRGGVPNYILPERAVSAVEAAVKYGEWLKKKKGTVPKIRARRAEVDGIFQNTLDLGLTELGDRIAQRVVAAYGIETPVTELATSSSLAARIASKIGFPVAMKINSPDILHKSDIGGVKVNIQSASEARAAYNTMIDNARRYMPQARIEGVTVQQMITEGKEVILGVKKDSQFGPMIMFGLGGIYVEIMKDVSFRIAPLTEDDATEMIRSIKAYPLLCGARGEEPSDIDAIRDALVRVSALAMDFPQIIEMDINPLKVMPKSTGGAVSIDSRITLSPGE
ncbi:MAG: acetate--CoA ligase family protein [Candidatus Tritonobacter lacicola]|nr:acetate--CoA ligase family protein [Candidatus Tritonobacter lacicola]